MATFDRGDVILVYFPWKDENGEIQFKSRPGIVLHVEADQKRLIIQITSRNRSGQFPGKWVLANSKLGLEMGLKKDSFIHYTKQAEINIRDVKRVIGYCSIIEDIQDELDELGLSST